MRRNSTTQNDLGLERASYNYICEWVLNRCHEFNTKKLKDERKMYTLKMKHPAKNGIRLFYIGNCMSHFWPCKNQFFPIFDKAFTHFRCTPHFTARIPHVYVRVRVRVCVCLCVAKTHSSVYWQNAAFFFPFFLILFRKFTIPFLACKINLSMKIVVPAFVTISH